LEEQEAMKVMMVALAALLAWETAVAGEPPSIIQGFGKTKWGQTTQEVAALVTPSSGPPLPRGPGCTVLMAAGEGPFDQVEYSFRGDRLVGVYVHIPAPAGVALDDAYWAIDRILDAKYRDETKTEAFQAIKDSGITIASQRGGPRSGITVIYFNRRLDREIVAQEQERLRQQASEALKQMGLDRLL
jgi:hypothetical protein